MNIQDSVPDESQQQQNKKKKGKKRKKRDQGGANEPGQEDGSSLVANQTTAVKQYPGEDDVQAN